MADRILEIADDFWNIRGSFRVLGFVNIGTHASLVRLSNGNFVFLDSYTLKGDVKRSVMNATDNGTKVEAILNLHPFHTVHCANMHRDFPSAKLYGTARHADQLPGLPWEPLRTETEALQLLYSTDLEFSIPRGVDFISSDESVHFSSVLAYHPSSKTIHSDDTLMCIRWFGSRYKVSFHPMLGKAMEKRPGAAADFLAWGEGLAERWRDAENLCAAHTNTLCSPGEPLQLRILEALQGVSGRLRAHAKKYG